MIERQNKAEHIFLIGFMGVGKSTIAQYLSKQLDIEKVEMDEKIEEQEQMPITQIFEEYGEPYFRNLETNLLIELQQKQQAVVSCGGGIIMRPENISHMKKSGKVVWLTALPETVYERVKDSDERPILNHHMNVEFIAGLMEQRREKYESAADIIVSTDQKSTDDICEEIRRSIFL